MTDEQPRMFRLASVPASISSGWSLAWRVLLIAIAITFVLGSLWELKLDFSQAGPLIFRSRDIYPVPDTGGYPANRQFNFGISGVRGHAHVVVILTGLDTANNAVRAQIGVSLDQALAGQLRLVDGSRKLPLNDSDSSRWATLPVKVQLVQCISRSCTAESSVQMRLRDLLPADTAPFTSTVDL